MTKEEVVAAMRNHRGQVRDCFLAVESVLEALISGWTPSGGEGGVVSDMKSLLDSAKDLIGEAKTALDGWPE